MPLPDWIDLTKLPAKVIAVIAVVCAIVIFIPVTWIPELQLAEFKKSFGMFIGVTLLITAALSIVSGVGWIAKQVSDSAKRRRESARRKEEVLVALRQLDANEKAVLREFLIQGNTVLMPISDPPVAALLHRGILYNLTLHGSSDIWGVWLPLARTTNAMQHLTDAMIDKPAAPLTTRNRLRPQWAKEEQEMKDLGKFGG